jgi:hypothetical protein
VSSSHSLWYLITLPLYKTVSLYFQHETPPDAYMQNLKSSSEGYIDTSQNHHGSKAMDTGKKERKKERAMHTYPSRRPISIVCVLDCE